MKAMTRTYEMKRRGESQDKTRQKIVEAAIHLHQTKGIVATTMADIAVRAKVGRVTVYRHFPDETALVQACSGQYFERHPLPDPEPWRSIKDPAERLRAGLAETYAHHRDTEAMMTSVLADAHDHPLMKPYHDHWQRAADVLAVGWGLRGRRKRMLQAGIALALSFECWRTLACDQGLGDNQAVELMTRLACKCPPKS